jgi:hypothetical protein
MSLLLPRAEHDVLTAVYALVRESGHLECGAWMVSPDNPAITCACGATFLPIPGASRAGILGGEICARNEAGQ